ncbi:hypothetical protein PQ462_10890 [Flavobacterium sp. KACC 22758]|uniref:hypothetical protein n=1 Tax=Flavobacterium sp. KACC 22758 TaxID=3025667 RepID=UPI002366290C|nr:hypothetical protein [Flavobacterium sp. KACC 22758]WDF61873.1 hypothetical protein PQ462_10890 [Flavobacterium sp. KACC 22758]
MRTRNSNISYYYNFFTVTEAVVHTRERKDKDWDILHGNKAAKPFFGRNEVPIVFITAFLDKVL